MKNIKKRIIFILIPLFTIIFSCAQNDLTDKIGTIEDNSIGYYVTYECPDCTNTSGLPVDATRYYKGDPVTVQGAENDIGVELKKDDDWFIGWDTKPMCNPVTGPEYGPDDVYIIQESDVTFYAQWKAKPNFTGGGLYFDFDIADTSAIGSPVEGRYPDSDPLNFRYAANSGIKFPFGDSVKKIERKFFISETVVTNNLFREVLQWAFNKNKFKQNNSGGTDENRITETAAKYGGEVLIRFSDSDITFHKNGSDKFTVPIDKKQHPVTGVTLYGAIMFCNWLTEMFGGIEVYQGITKSSFPIDPNYDYTGYRLPTSVEWEYAARYLGSDTGTSHFANEYNIEEGITYGWDGDTVDIQYSECIHSLKTGPIPCDWSSLTPGYYWAPWNYLSGAKTYYDNDHPLASYFNQGAGDYWNKKVAVFGVSSTAQVGSKGLDGRNALGLYDMSGNVGEWCTDEGSFFYVRGGSYNTNPVGNMVVSYANFNFPRNESKEVGFRLAKTKELIH